MRHCRSIIVRVAILSAMIFSGHVRAQESRPSPPSAQTLQDEFNALVQMLNQRTLDMGKADVTDAGQRQAAINQAISRLAKNLHDAAVDEQAIRDLARDAVTYRISASPRLTGNVVRVGPKQAFADLAAAQPRLRPGDLVVLDAGEYPMMSSRRLLLPPDVAIVGHGADATRLIFGRDSELSGANRLLIEGVRIDCRDNPICDLRAKNDGLTLRACEIGNYNSGAGGSNAIFASDGILLLEQCLFDGEKGRAAGNRMLGNALDLRGAWLVARQCQFVNNNEILRAGDPAIFDGCTMLNTIEHGAGVSLSARNGVWLRDSDSILDARTPAANVNRFAYASDDLEFVQHVVDPTKPVDDASRQLAQSLALHRRLPYWISLIRHEDTRVRQLAAAQLTKLVDIEVNLPTEQQRERERLADLGVLFAVEQEYTRLTAWFEKNRDRLQWDQASGRYRSAQNEAERPE